MKKMILIMLISAFGLLTLSACSTISGVGKDLQDVGGAISNKAENSKKKI